MGRTKGAKNKIKTIKVKGPGSGNYKRTYEMFKHEKEGRYKVYSLSEIGSDTPFFYGVTKHFTCKAKATLIYSAKIGMHPNSALYNKIRELEYKFVIYEEELLNKDFSFKDAKLHLQENYIDTLEPECNKMTYCFCHKPTKNPRLILSEETKQNIIKDYKTGNYTAKELVIKYNTMPNQVRCLLKRTGNTWQSILYGESNNGL